MLDATETADWLDNGNLMFVDVVKRVGQIQVDALQEAAKWCCLNGSDTKIPEVEEIRQRILKAADEIEKATK